MCLGIPGRVVEVTEGELRFGTVRFGAIEKSVCLACVPEAGVGDYVIVHVGFAISRVDEREAERTLSLLAELGAAEELESEPREGPG